MMGMGPQMGPLIPTGMVLTRPSDVKNQEKLALSRLEEEKKEEEVRQSELRQEEERVEA
jgi:hypothetical protein